MIPCWNKNAVYVVQNIYICVFAPSELCAEDIDCSDVTSFPSFVTATATLDDGVLKARPSTYFHGEFQSYRERLGKYGQLCA